MQCAAEAVDLLVLASAVKAVLPGTSTMHANVRLHVRMHPRTFFLSSFLISVISLSLDAMIFSHACRCFSISVDRSCGTSIENRSAQRIATAAFCRADCSASANSLARSSCRCHQHATRRPNEQRAVTSCGFACTTMHASPWTLPCRPPALTLARADMHDTVHAWMCTHARV